mmetsp:Transcript_24673/g.32132  ORF Transcript_24673/g.32132 Transcript_24673/m.32132 type:complete len:339 (+) Transcript_24673:46-1062(+)|eukprot:CAMPEP_0114333522 /NCGR_PEP_ID=MMETSP0101-20121206/3809_1 /TAXON_ID=38822 ORGANISM="Pteridomonas danica, Strain PT" /NCGR_SAMPLE_ID=MMETSP0101 /ASSEMBLY_ACC=CAM_ASM_000211 /LENGTH=338 /DNA_ID=CAMNT_0001464565 /DNA_START=32 /DNA_END=1048 /DNA_ORIENTATION=+
MASSSIASKFQQFRGVFAGAGSGFFIEPIIVDAVLDLANQISKTPQLLYIGTCSYDSPTAKLRQIQGFIDRGISIKTLEFANVTPPEGQVDKLIDSSDIIVVSGGNTLFGIDRMKIFGVDIALKRAAYRGAVLCGGSAGAICWFDGGHSDSMDTASYQKEYLALNSVSDGQIKDGPSATEFEPTTTTDSKNNKKQKLDDEPKSWKYIRSPCLGLLPGLMCPHHDQVQSNGVLRATDFEAMLKRHPGEQGICIDHYCALVIDNGKYRVVSLEGKSGSVEGKPGVWLKNVVVTNDDEEKKTVIEAKSLSEGNLDDILKEATSIQQDPLVEQCRAENPSNF